MKREIRTNNIDTDAPTLSGLIDTDRFLAIDTEGSGGKFSEIVELAFIEFDLDAQTYVERFWLIRPRREISNWATRIHGIRECDKAKAPHIEEVESEVSSHPNGANLIMHNASTDIGFLRRHVSGWTPKNVFDTLKVLRRKVPEAVSYKLENLCDAFELTPQCSPNTSHRALTDAYNCMKLFQYLVSLTAAPPRQRVLFERLHMNANAIAPGTWRLSGPK